MKPSYWKIGAVVLALVALAVVFTPQMQGDLDSTSPILKTQLFRP